MNSPTVVLSVHGLTRRFGDHVVLDDISFEVRAGEAVGVVGPNGSGKSTLLQCVVGAQHADDGSVALWGEPLKEEDPAVRAALSVVDDSIEFFAGLTAVENLNLLAAAHDVPDADAVIALLLAELRLVDQRHQLPTSVSSGQRRRLALAMGLVRPWSLLVLDEPEQRLDSQGLSWLTGRLLKAKADGGAILFASHDAALIDAVADRRITVGTAE